MCGGAPDDAIEYAKSGYLNFMHKAKILGGGITKRVDDGVVMFFDTGSTYMMHTESERYAVPYPGRYRITLDARPYQADTPVLLTLYQGIKQGTVASLDNLIGAYDLVDDTSRTVELTTFMRPGDLLAPSVAELDVPSGSYVNHFAPDKTVENYRGEGVAIKSLTVEGLLIDEWPPGNTRRLLAGLEFDERGLARATKAPEEHILDIVRRFATRAFRRPLHDGEMVRRMPSRNWRNRRWRPVDHCWRPFGCRCARFSARRRSSTRRVPRAG